MERLRRALRGADHGELPGLPVGEAMHPVTLLAVVVLVVNDWVLKPALHGGIGAVITGKLSDVAGLVFAPVVFSAAIGLALAGAARLGARVDPYLTQRRLVLCIAATGLGFAAVKLSPAAADALAHALSHLGRRASIQVDRTDLLALPALLVAYWIGRDELRRLAAARR
ncbi:MAG TPA: hypothetical protein VLB44_00700 [Kofleriaceae bacterium]|nr:hypothetical protein [Kofleriaceae bacterium]